MNSVSHYLLHPQIIVLALLVLSATAVHLRGRVRLKFARQLTDHSTFVAPYNAFAYLTSKAPNRAYLDVSQFPELKTLTDNWRTIRDEGLRLMDEGMVRGATAHNDIGFHTFFKRGWKRFYLKWYDAPQPSAEALCPQTVALLKQVPSVHGAMFATLPPGGRLGAHRDPFAGSVRYHLGLRTPNSDACWIEVDGRRYSWRDGEAVMFDETFVHTAENTTDVTRLILFCDVERPLWGPAAAVNRFVMRHVMRATATQNVEGERVGAINRAFGTIHAVKEAGQRLKARNRRLYYGLKYAVIAAVLALFLSGRIDGVMPAPLKRSMGVMGVLLLTLSGVTPASSVFIGVPEVISEAGTGALISMIIGALLAAPITCVYAELSSAFPIAGGEYALVGRTLGPAPGFAILGLTVAVNMLSPAVLALGVAANLRPIFPGLDPTWTAEAILVATTLLGVLHIRTNAWVTGVFLFLELAALGVLTTLGFLHAQNPLGGFLAHPVVLSGGGFHPASAAAIGLSVSVAIFVYNGFGSAVYFAEEMHEAPKLVARTILWAGLISVLTVFLPLVAVLAGAPDLKGLLASQSPFSAFLDSVGAGWLKTAMGLAVALAILNAVLACILQNSRFFYSSGRDQAWHPVINTAFQVTHPKTNSPWISTLAAGGSAMLMCFIGLDRLLVLTGAGLAFTYAVLSVAAVAGRLNKTTSAAAWRMPLGVVVAGLGLAGSAYALWAEWLDADVGRMSLAATAAFLAVSVIYYGAVVRRRGAWSIRDPG